MNLNQTSLGGKYIKFREAQDIYLEVEIIGYNKTNNSIHLNIVDYQPQNIEKFKEQTAKAHVFFIYFEPLKWQQIEKYLSSYTKSKLIHEKIIIDDVTPTESYDINSIHNEIKPSNQLVIKREPVLEKISEEANIYFKDADFNLGFVSFSHKSKILNEVFNLKIENHFLLPEFNAVKSYFPKAFGGKKQFLINIDFILTNKTVTNIITTSPEIEKINETIIDSIKRERVAKLTSTPLLKSIDKSLFTADDIFDSFEDNLKDGNVFNQSELDILNFIIETRKVRNAKHLEFLSGSKHSTKQKLRFTLKPLFGFLFFIEGETKNHFCWELLNSHATYLWSFGKIDSDIIFQYKRVEETINIIRNMGRDSYKNEYKRKNVDIDMTFCTIEHSSINSAFKEGFVEWRHRLLEIII